MTGLRIIGVGGIGIIGARDISKKVALTGDYDDLKDLAEAFARELPDDGDADELTMLCGQPRKLYGAGTPAEATVPINWLQLADGGYNWHGLPSAIGQEYIDTTNGKKYEAVWNNYAQRTLKWLAV